MWNEHFSLLVLLLQFGTFASHLCLVNYHSHPPVPVGLVSVSVGALPRLSLAAESGDGPRQGLLGQQKGFS